MGGPFLDNAVTYKVTALFCPVLKELTLIDS